MIGKIEVVYPGFDMLPGKSGLVRAHAPHGGIKLLSVAICDPRKGLDASGRDSSYKREYKNKA